MPARLLLPQPGYTAESVLPLACMPLNEVSQAWAVLARPPALAEAAAKMPAVLRFTVKEIDPSTGEAEEEGYEDEYQVRCSSTHCVSCMAHTQ